jgi:hypothetical protein
LGKDWMERSGMHETLDGARNMLHCRCHSPVHSEFPIAVHWETAIAGRTDPGLRTSRQLELTMSLEPCLFRRPIVAVGDVYQCDHRHVRTEAGLVDAAVCVTCHLREVPVTSHSTRGLGGAARQQAEFENEQVRAATSQTPMVPVEDPASFPGPHTASKDPRRRVAFLARTDFANVMTSWAKAIRRHSRTLEAASVCLRPHSFNYELQHDFDLSPHQYFPGRGEGWADLVTHDRVAAARDYLESADFVVQGDELDSHQVFSLFEQLLGVDLMSLPRQQLAIYHGGTAFRNDAPRRNKRDAEFQAQLTHPDLYRLGGRNRRPIFPVLQSVPTREEITTKFHGDRLLIVHTPSKVDVKGSAVIRQIVARVQAALPERNVEYQEITGVSNDEVLARKREAHIHIDQFNDLGERGVGGIGVSALEGFQAGNLVLCSLNHILPEVWRAWDLDPEHLPLIDLGTDQEEFHQKLLEICRQPNSTIAELVHAHCQTAYAALQPRRIAEFFESLFDVHASSPSPAPAVRMRASSAVIVVPHWPSPSLFHKKRYTNMLRQAFQAEMVSITSERGLLEKVMAHRPELVITMNLPLYGIFSDKLIHDLPRSVKLVTWHDDLRRQMHPNLPTVLERSDAVVSVLRQAVLRDDQFPDIRGKLWRLPWFIPASIPPYPLHPSPVRRCLVPGIIRHDRLLRQRAVREIAPERLALLPHPGFGRKSYDDAVVGKDFYELIHQHACCLTDGGIYGYVVAKYLEVPYTSTLLLAEDVPDLAEMGYRAGEHFLAITQDTDLHSLVEDILTHLDDFQAIRRAGQSLVMERHTEPARLAEANQMAQSIRATLGLAPLRQLGKYGQVVR